MKYRFVNTLYSVIAAFLVFCSCKMQLSNSTSQNSDVNVFRSDSLWNVYKIDSINSYYVIYAEKNHKFYKIISKKNLDNCDEKIQKNLKYNFLLKSIWSESFMIGNTKIVPSQSLGINCFYFVDDLLGTRFDK